MEEIKYGLWDSRYTTKPDRATMYSMCGTLKEAKKEKREDWPDAVIVEHTIKGDYIIKSEIVKP